jgi:ribosomal protein S17E
VSVYAITIDEERLIRMSHNLTLKAYKEYPDFASSNFTVTKNVQSETSKQVLNGLVGYMTTSREIYVVFKGIMDDDNNQWVVGQNQDMNLEAYTKSPES